MYFHAVLLYFVFFDVLCNLASLEIKNTVTHNSSFVNPFITIKGQKEERDYIIKNVRMIVVEAFML